MRFLLGSTCRRFLGIVAAASVGGFFLALAPISGITAPPAQASTIGGGPGRVVIWGNTAVGGNDIRLLNGPTYEGATAISARGDMAMWLNWDGTVGVWRRSSTIGTIPPTGLSGVKAIAAGGNFALALKTTGEVMAWGDDTNHQTDVPAAAKSGVTFIAAGSNAAFAIKSDGTYVTWGDNSYGQLSAGWWTTMLGKPMFMPYLGISKVSLNTQGIGLQSGGTVVAWGQNASGQATVPSGLKGVTALATGDGFSTALGASGLVLGWGDNSKGQLNAPCIGVICIKGKSPATGYTAIAAGGKHALGLHASTVHAWGDNAAGESTVPIEAGGNDIVAVAAGADISVALEQLPGPPPAPTKVSATPGNKSALVTASPSADGGAPLTLITVTSSPGNVTATCPAVAAWDGSYQCAVGGLQNGTTYTFTMTFKNGLGTGPASAPSNAVTPLAYKVYSLSTPSTTRPASSGTASGAPTIAPVASASALLSGTPTLAPEGSGVAQVADASAIATGSWATPTGSSPAAPGSGDWPPIVLGGAAVAVIAGVGGIAFVVARGMVGHTKT